MTRDGQDHQACWKLLLDQLFALLVKAESSFSLTRLKGVKRPVTQSKIAGRESLSQIPRLVRIAIADCHVRVEDGEFAHTRRFLPAHEELAHFGARAVGADED